MKALKSSLVVLSVFVLGLLVSPVAQAQWTSILGKEIADGPEFVKVVGHPNNSNTSNAYLILHKEKIASITADPYFNTESSRYNITLTNGIKYWVDKPVFEALVAQLEVVDLKY